MGWIQIGSKLPAEGQYIIGFDADLPKHPFIFVYRNGRWLHPNEEHFEGLRVTHWMPLPDPPTERPRKGRIQHGWVSAHPDPEVNMRCSKCGMEQKPEYKGSVKEYYRQPGGQWEEHKLVPFCRPR